MLVNNSKAVGRTAVNPMKGHQDSMRLKRAWALMRGGKPKPMSSSSQLTGAFHSSRQAHGNVS